MPPRTSSRSRCICRFRRSRRALRARSKWVKKRTAVAVRFFWACFAVVAVRTIRRSRGRGNPAPLLVAAAKAGIHLPRHSGEGRNPLTPPSFRRRPESTLSVIPAKAGIHFDLCLFFCSVFRAIAITDSRPVRFVRHPWRPVTFSLLAKEKVTKENGTLGSAPSPGRAVRCGRTGFAHRPSMACCRNRRDPSRRPRAVHAAFPFALRRGSEGTQEPALTLALSRKRERGS